MIKEFLLDFFFPSYCISCQKEGSYICDKCSLFISESRQVCPYCMKFKFNGRPHKKCYSKSILVGLASFWDHEFLIKKLILKSKEEGFYDITKRLTQDALLLSLNDKRFSYFLDFLESADAITYVPNSIKDKKRRGFDQSKVIANQIGKISGIPVFDLINKNESGFVKSKSQVFNKVVLVDDYLISGKTINNCAIILKEMGVFNIYGFVLSKKP